MVKLSRSFVTACFAMERHPVALCVTVLGVTALLSCKAAIKAKVEEKSAASSSVGSTANRIEFKDSSSAESGVVEFQLQWTDDVKAIHVGLATDESCTVFLA